jgi:hypothetical protein
VDSNRQTHLTGLSVRYFTLLPGETKAITAECPANLLKIALKITMEGLNVPLQDIVAIK